MAFFMKLDSCWWSTAAVAPRVDQDGAAAEELKEQSVGRMRSSKSESAAHWRPALTAISEDRNGAQSQAKKSGEKKLEKKTSGRRGRFMAKSYSYHGGHNYWTNSMPMVVMPPFSSAPFMF